MPWFVAHNLMVLRPQVPIDEPLLCWENMILLEADFAADVWGMAPGLCASPACFIRSRTSRKKSPLALAGLAGVNDWNLLLGGTGLTEG